MATRTTTFIAVQCSQCSTMQVKQLKRSSNKWVCAVCNQRQSVRRIHARGPLARDIRHFVQSFNISRCDLPSGGPLPPAPPSDVGGCHASSISSSSLPVETDRRRRMDWSEYLDPDEDQKEDGAVHSDSGDPFEPKVFAEMSENKFPQRTFTKYPRGAQATGVEAEWKDGGSHLKPTLTKRPRECGANKDKMAAVEGRSKWSQYLEAEEEEEEKEEECHDAWNSGTWEQLSGADMVEDEVHPDFK